MIIKCRQKAKRVGGHKGSKTIILTPNKKNIQVKQNRNKLKFTFGLDEVQCQLSKNI